MTLCRYQPLLKSPATSLIVAYVATRLASVAWHAGKTLLPAMTAIDIPAARMPAAEVLTGPMCNSPPGAVDLLADADDLAVEVNVLPAQAESFAPAHPVQQQQDECGVEGIIAGALEEGQRFGRSPRDVSAGSHSGSSTSRATLRLMSSSRMARDSAELRTWRMIWTFPTEQPAWILPFRNAWTIGTDSRLSGYLPSPGVRWTRTAILYSPYVDGRQFGLITLSSQ